MRQNPYERPDYKSQMNYNRTAYETEASSVTGEAVDAKSRFQKIMTRTFLFMFLGLAVSGITAFVINYFYQLSIQNGDEQLYSAMSAVMIVALIMEIVFVIISNVAVRKNHALLAGIMFFLYSAANGASISCILSIYTEGSVLACFIGAAVLFAVMALWGFVTKRDLSVIGNIGFMLLIGIIVMGILNFLVFRSTGLDLLISVVGLAVFIGLTAYDTKKIKQFALENNGYSEMTIAMFGALILYLDFINMFLHLLQLFGKKN